MNRTKRVLIVEDHADTRVMLQRLLERAGYQVMSVGTCSEAIKLAQGGNIDLLITDLLLPDGSGMDLLREIHPKNQHVQGIVCSGVDRPAVAAECKAAGYAAFLSKPVKFDELLVLVDGHAQRTAPLSKAPNA